MVFKDQSRQNFIQVLNIPKLTHTKTPSFDICHTHHNLLYLNQFQTTSSNRSHSLDVVQITIHYIVELLHFEEAQFFVNFVSTFIPEISNHNEIHNILNYQCTETI